jgi:O-antigen ligase
MIRLYYLLLLLMPFWNYPRLPKFGETWTVIKIIGAIVVVAAGFQALLYGSRARLLAWRESRLFLILLLWAILSASTISRWEWAENPLTSCISIAAYLYPTLIFLNTPETVYKASHWIIVSMLLASYSVFSQFVKYGVGRPGGVVGDPNYFALVAVSMLPLCLLLLPTVQGAARLIFAVTAIAIIAATLLGASRGGFISLIFCVGYLVFHGRHRVALLCAFGIVILALDRALPHTPLDRLMAEDAGSRVSTEIRKQLLKAGWEMIKTHPLAGVGLGMYKPLAPEYNAALQGQGIGHNTYLEVAAELGAPALALFLAILWTAWRRARRTAEWFRCAGQPAAARIARAVEAGIVGYAAGALFLSAQFAKQLWILVWLGLALARIAAEQQEQIEATLAPEEPYALQPGLALRR